MERRRNAHTPQTPMETLRQLPALVALERIPVPVLAIADDGTSLFANTGFAGMLGYTQEEVLALEFRQIFGDVPPAEESALSVMHSLANSSSTSPPTRIARAPSSGSGISPISTRRSRELANGSSARTASRSR